jgi:hypothetical protein
MLRSLYIVFSILGLSLSLSSSNLARSVVAKSKFSIPIGTKWQIVLSGTPVGGNSMIPNSAVVWDVDLFDTPQTTIAGLKANGKTVLCYFSAGTFEPDRPDLGVLVAGDIGGQLDGWPGEYWLNLKSPTVQKIMANRIALAAAKGCDAVDPDNTGKLTLYLVLQPLIIKDAFEHNGGGVGLTSADSVAFVRGMAATALSYGLAIGLKNSQDILPQVSDVISFAVNEQCSQYKECPLYNSLLASNKPVFNIEYTKSANLCVNPSLSTVYKHMNLNGWVRYCDGTQFTTQTD